MKIILALGLSLMTTAAFSQDYDSGSYEDTSYDQGVGDAQFQEAPRSQRMELAEPGVRHMLEFNVDSALRAAVSFEKVKTRYCNFKADDLSSLKIKDSNANRVGFELRFNQDSYLRYLIVRVDKG